MEKALLKSREANTQWLLFKGFNEMELNHELQTDGAVGRLEWRPPWQPHLSVWGLHQTPPKNMSGNHHGLLVWSIDGGAKHPVASEDTGKFYNGDCYIVLYSYHSREKKRRLFIFVIGLERIVLKRTKIRLLS